MARKTSDPSTPHKGRPLGTSPASALTGALGSPWPELQHTRGENARIHATMFGAVISSGHSAEVRLDDGTRWRVRALFGNDPRGHWAWSAVCS